MKKSVLLIALTLLTSSCVTPNKATMDNSPSGTPQRSSEISCAKGELTRENALERRSCIDQRLLMEHAKLKDPNIEAIHARVNANRLSAQEYAEGKISEEEYDKALDHNEEIYSGVAQSQDKTTPEKQMALCAKEKLTKKNAVKRQDCYDTAFVRSLGSYPHMELINMFVANNRMATVDYLEGRLSQPKYAAVIAQNFASLQQVMKQADVTDAQAQQLRAAQQQTLENQQRLYNAQQEASRDAKIQNLANMMQGMAVAVQPKPAPVPQTTNCHQMGAFINCTTY